MADARAERPYFLHTPCYAYGIFWRKNDIFSVLNNEKETQNIASLLLLFELVDV